MRTAPPVPPDAPTVAASDLDASGEAPLEGAVVLVFSECRSMAPAFRVAIAIDGTVTFIGDRNVSALGRHGAHVDAAEVSSLIARIHRAGFSDFHARYTCTETPTNHCNMHPCYTAVRIRDGATVRTVVRSNDAPSVPPQLIAIVADIERVARTERWIGDAGAP